MAYAGPDFLEVGQRILAIPIKRGPRRLLGFFTRDEVNALLAGCNGHDWSIRRDQLLFTLLYNTGARVSEAIALRVGDAHGEVIQLHGKGRKDRAIPLWSQTRRMLHQWRKSNALKEDQLLFTNRRGAPLTRAGVSFRLSQAIRRAIPSCPSLKRQGISPHTFRHSTALHLLQSGVALEVIALWLGHESPVTTHSYIEADLKMKAETLRSLDAPPTPPRYARQQYPRLLAFLEAL